VAERLTRAAFGAPHYAGSQLRPSSRQLHRMNARSLGAS
jgi:hypothetical protein